MEFCPECGAMLLPKSDGKLECSCGYKKELTEDYSVSRKVEAKETVKVLGEEEIKGTGVNEVCPECGHDKATYILLQTRSADEAPTRIFTCNKCKHKWRAYD
jgi:DNA-directed RNA polymerase subunit M